MRHVLFLSVLVATLLSVAGEPARAGTQPAPLAAGLSPAILNRKNTEVEPGARKDHVTILVLDMSRSMGFRNRDPGNLRCSAARLYLALSPPTDYVGLVIFPAKVDWTKADIVIRPDQPVGLQGNLRDKVVCHAAGATPMAAALEQAYSLLDEATNQGNRTGSAILLSDGEPDPQTKQDAEDWVDKFRSRGWKIDAIALIDPTDPDPQEQAKNKAFVRFMQGVAEDTAGHFYLANNALQLQPFFIEILARRTGRQLEKPELLTVEPGSGPIPFPFTVSKYARHFDLLITREEGIEIALWRPGSDPQVDPPVGPDEPGVIYLSEAHALVYSIDQPQAGQWTLSIRGTRSLGGSTEVSIMQLIDYPENRVRLVRPDRPLPFDPLYMPYTLVAEIRDERGNILAVADAEAVITNTSGYSITVPLNDRQLNGDERAGDGYYSAHWSPPPDQPAGNYEVVLNVTLESIRLTRPAETITLRPIPQVRLINDRVSVPVHSSAEVRVGFFVDKQQVDPSGLELTAFLLEEGAPQELQVRREGSEYVLTVPEKAGVQEWGASLEVMVEGTYRAEDTGEEVEIPSARPVTLTCRVVYKPSLYLQPLVELKPVYPVGWPITYTVGLLDAEGSPLPLPARGSIRVVVGQENKPTEPCEPWRDDGKGGDKKAGDGILTGICPARDHAGEHFLVAEYKEENDPNPIKQSIPFSTQYFPEVHLEQPSITAWVDWGILGTLYSRFPFSLLRELILGRKESVVLRGQVQQAGQPYVDWQSGDLKVWVIGGGTESLFSLETQPSGFLVRWMPSKQGTYQVHATWTGDYAGRKNYVASSVMAVQVDEGIAPRSIQVATAWFVGMLWVLIWLIFLILTFLLLRAWTTAPFVGLLYPQDSSHTHSRPAPVRQGIDLGLKAKERRCIDRFFHPSWLDACLWMKVQHGAQRQPVQPGLLRLESKWALFQGPRPEKPVSLEWQVVRQWALDLIRSGLWRWIFHPELGIRVLRKTVTVRVAGKPYKEGDWVPLDNGVTVDIGLETGSFGSQPAHETGDGVLTARGQPQPTGQRYRYEIRSTISKSNRPWGRRKETKDQRGRRQTAVRSWPRHQG